MNGPLLTSILLNRLDAVYFIFLCAVHFLVTAVAQGMCLMFICFQYSFPTTFLVSLIMVFPLYSYFSSD